MIPYGRQTIEDEDVEAVVRALRSPFLTQGPAVPAFEAALAARVGAAEAVAMNSATSALHAACLALGLGPGERYWTVPNTFVATANVARQCGAEVGFVDVDAAGLLDLDALETRLAAAAAQGALPRIVAPVHFAGRSVEMARLGRLRDRYGFRVLEDASHALGAVDGGAAVGACAHSDVAVFSFHPVKILTTAEGGAALTNDAALAARLRRLRSHGIEKDPAAFRRPADGPWSYEQVELGFNYRMTDLQAALGLSQLGRLDRFLERRRELARRYGTALAGAPGLDPPAPDTDRSLSAWHLYVVRLDAAIDRRRVFEALHARGIGVQVLYIPVHLQPFWREAGHRPGDYPGAESHYAQTFTLPIFPTLSDADADRASGALCEILAGTARSGGA